MAVIQYFERNTLYLCKSFIELENHKPPPSMPWLSFDHVLEWRIPCQIQRYQRLKSNTFQGTFESPATLWEALEADVPDPMPPMVAKACAREAFAFEALVQLLPHRETLLQQGQLIGALQACWVGRFRSSALEL